MQVLNWNFNVLAYPSFCRKAVLRGGERLYQAKFATGQAIGRCSRRLCNAELLRERLSIREDKVQRDGRGLS